MKQDSQIIGYQDSSSEGEVFYSFNPENQINNEFRFHKATLKEINQAVEKASAAFHIYRKKSGKEKASFLNAIAAGLINAGQELTSVCCSETGLPAARIEGEKMRTVNQLKMFAALITEGSWLDARIDTSMPERVPVPKPDLRYMQIPLGPVVVFGASNFPLAFSVAGGDTASALAAGCTVIVKAHPAHPATSAIVGKIILEAAKSIQMPDGVFSMLFDSGIEVGLELVKHPLVKAVGFTGSYKAGKALYDAVVTRPEPIPLYAEMGSINPVFVLPQAMKTRGGEIAAGYATSVTQGVGQFCTNPGLLVVLGKDNEFENALKKAFEKTVGGVMLTPHILKNYQSGIEHYMSISGVEILAHSSYRLEANDNCAIPVLISTSMDVLETNTQLLEELFGPSGIVIPLKTTGEMLSFAKKLKGQLTATIHGTEEELSDYGELIDLLEQIAGRVIVNGFPTGVEVCSAMVHGGPFPSTTDSKSTSVGTAAIYRFTRPVCYQNMPQHLLPEELKNKNVLNISRLVNGERSSEDI
ncbi:MAG: hypothetical protein RLZZ420_1836 [Bacteroidota bacterium]|jgi:acyl-CoA reductase-like NAD-dependent aldehyde dehydrogenase